MSQDQVGAAQASNTSFTSSFDREADRYARSMKFHTIVESEMMAKYPNSAFRLNVLMQATRNYYRLRLSPEKKDREDVTAKLWSAYTMAAARFNLAIELKEKLAEKVEKMVQEHAKEKAEWAKALAEARSGVAEASCVKDETM